MIPRGPQQKPTTKATTCPEERLKQSTQPIHRIQQHTGIQHAGSNSNHTHDGNSSTCEEWKCSFAAYMGLMDTAYPRLLLQAETSDERLRDTDLRNAGAKRMKQTDGYNFQSTSSTFSSTPPQEQQPQHADNTNQIWASKSIDSKVTGSQFHWEHVASATSHGFSSPYSTTAALKSHSPTGSLNSHATSVATTRTYQTQSRSQS